MHERFIQPISLGFWIHQTVVMRQTDGQVIGVIERTDKRERCSTHFGINICCR
ncbi:unnamed protein product [Brugia timori]|uniref:Transposase n=1 Tax=Brugia timori TaxID=42155 RepID=A0A0R3QPQ2_9BILA|nr:unnamed protein product [Brugia timori]